jgi:hypothetical protein
VFETLAPTRNVWAWLMTARIHFRELQKKKRNHFRALHIYINVKGGKSPAN